MESNSKANESKVNIIFRLPGIRHIRAVFELLNIFFWKNTLGKGDYIQPDGDDIEKVYNIWYGLSGKKVIIPNAIYIKMGPVWKVLLLKIPFFKKILRKRKHW